MTEWLGALGILSAVLFIGSLVVTPWLITLIPEDYFSDPERHRSRLSLRHPLLRTAIRMARNLAGAVLILGGIAMLVLPGQGLLTLLAGLILLDFPGKYPLERYLVTLPHVLPAINWLRRRAGKAPLLTGKKHPINQ